MRCFTTRKWLLQKTLVSVSKQTYSSQYRLASAFAVMDNIETIHHKKMVAAEKHDFRFEADFFNSEPMILGFGCHGQQ